MVLNTVAFDIETTGFQVHDQLTVIGFDSDVGSQIFLNSGKTTYSTTLESQINNELSSPVSISVTSTEQGLLREMAAFVESTISLREVKLVAYNGERWNGGFDLPFLRTRLADHEIDWPFTDLPYIDAMDAFETRFNTTEDTLEGVYRELIGGKLTTLDPFTDSEEAVEAWKQGNFKPLVLHNIADIRRTRALIRLAERYCSKSHFKMRSLDPVT